MHKSDLFSRLASFLLLAGTTLFFTSCEEGFLEELFRGDAQDDPAEVRIFASTNTGGNFTIFDVSDVSDVDRVTVNTGSMDADGIFYDAHEDIVYQLSRTESVVNAYTDISELSDNATVTPAFSSTSDFTNGREIAVNDHLLVVAEDVDDMNRLVVYRIEDDALTLDRVYDVDFNLWGIRLDGSTLFAIQDNDNKLAVFYDFGSQPEGDLHADVSVAIEGIVRTHGLDYDAKNDIMVLTDIGDAASDADGAFHVIEYFSAKLDEAGDRGTIALDKQVRVSGNRTHLGNPVDIALSVNEKKVYAAERATGGGRLLIFDYPTESGNVKPIANLDYAGASAVYVDEAKGY